MKIFIFATFIFQGVCTSQSSKKYILGENNLFLCRLAEPQEENGTPAPLALLSLRLGKENKPKEIMLAYLTACPVDQPTMEDIIKRLQEAEADSGYTEKVQRLFGLESADSFASPSRKLFASKNLKFDSRYSSSKGRYNHNFIEISDKAKTHEKEEKKKFKCRYKVNDNMQLTSMFFLTAEKKGSGDKKNTYTRSNCYMIDASKLFPTRENKPYEITLPVYKKVSRKQYTKVEKIEYFFREFLEPEDKNSECETLLFEQESEAPKFNLLRKRPVVSEVGPKVTIKRMYKGNAHLIQNNGPTVVLKRRYESEGSNHSTIRSAKSKENNTNDENKLLRKKSRKDQDSDGIIVCRGDINSAGCSLESKGEESGNDVDSDGRERSGEDSAEYNGKGSEEKKAENDGNNVVENSGEDGIEYDGKDVRNFSGENDDKERLEVGSIDRGQSDGSRRKIGESSRGKRVLSISGIFLLGGILTSFIATHLLYKKKGST